MAQTKSPDTASRILDAVTHLILAGGLPAVTLSAVCRKAGLSKGGLMHHYPSKESLVDAFLARSGEAYLNLVEQATKRYQIGSGRRAEAFVDLFLSDPTGFEPDANRDCAAVMMALIQGGGGKSTVRGFYEKIIRTLRADGLSLDLSELIVATLDGVWLQSMIETAEIIVPRASRLRRRLKRMIENEVKLKSIPKQSGKHAGKLLT